MSFNSCSMQDIIINKQMQLGLLQSLQYTNSFYERYAKIC
jgi:hypothetical protein